MLWVLGIDVAKASLEVALMDGAGGWQTGNFKNTPAGFTRLLKWLRKRTQELMPVCLEATGRYSRDVAAFLYAEGYAVSLVNPTRVSHYRQACGQLHKTDKQDAKLLAEYCTTHHPPLWTPPTFAQEELQEMTRYLESLKKEKTRVLNRLASGPFTQWVQRDLQEQLAQLKQRIAELEQEIKQVATQDDEQRRQIALLTSIKGIGELTALRFLAEVPDYRRFAHADQLAAYAGLVPKQHTSGTSVQRKSKLTKTGNAHLRSAFYLPALSAARHNPVIRAFAERLAARGKPKMTIVAAVMRKLIQLAYGVLKSGRPFDPNYSSQPAQT